MSTTNSLTKNLIACYPFDDAENVGKDTSGNGNNATALGTKAPYIQERSGRNAVVLCGGNSGTSYLELPKNILERVSDSGGITISTWVCPDKVVNIWERIFDFGQVGGPYLFLNRTLRGVCFAGSDIAADAFYTLPVGEWSHIAMTVTGTKDGSLSSAGPRIYVNGDLVADGFISQTSSGTYKKFREWFATLEKNENYQNNFIGHSQFDVDPDFAGAFSDFRIYDTPLLENEIISLMCEKLSEEDILALAREKYLPAPAKIITNDLILPKKLIENRVQVTWSSSPAGFMDADGHVTVPAEPTGIQISAELTCGEHSTKKLFPATVMPEFVAPYELTIHGDREVLDISKTLYGLFFEDINNSADGGIYAELISNRSFEEFTYEVYDARSGEDGISSGRNHNPLRFWFGDLDKAIPCYTGGLNEYFHLEDKDANACYINVQSGAKLYNRGFCDTTEKHSMKLVSESSYQFSIWAKTDEPSSITVTLMDNAGVAVSNSVTIQVEATGNWAKYTAEKLIVTDDVMGQIELSFDGNMCIDMVSLMPDDVWGAMDEPTSSTAHKNFIGNSNYRLRKDLVETLIDMHPTFLRFPGGCISEGSYIWENVYDWKDSVGPVETRKENFNTWGYTMTMGLGYMEYFQLAEDLNAEPLPVMACGVLCQARSDYANPAGGALQEKYINNFIDLIDFAISTDFENNKWAALRKEMGHEEPFELHYLGVGNENWGSEFFASFEEFYHRITDHLKKTYPNHELHIISTVGAQADDTAYQEGWKFLAGYMEGGDTIRFSDGKESVEKEVSWYPYQKNYLETIADEHYYRSNDYLLENADRYNYYYRPYDANGNLIEDEVSKVFVGEYASNAKNTLAGAVAEAAVMTGFEKNSDVVRLAATAPLFNKVLNDSMYRWTPDAIWFDNETVWRTPTYYVQKMFAEYIGTKLLDTDYYTYVDGKRKLNSPSGGISVAITEGTAILKNLTITSNKDNTVLFEQDFKNDLSDKLISIVPEDSALQHTDDGLLITSDNQQRHGFYINEPEWTNYTVSLTVFKKDDDAEILVGTGLSGVTKNDFTIETLSLHEYCVGYGRYGTGLKVIKEGKEGYRMGDYSSSVFAGNLRACFDEEVTAGQDYIINVNYGGTSSDSISCFYCCGDTPSVQKARLDAKLSAYTHDLFEAVTTDEKHVYVKLVNAEDFDKHLKVSLDNLDIRDQAVLVSLCGDISQKDVPNVNAKNDERIVPVTTPIYTAKDGFDIVLPANSVQVVILNKNANAR